MAPTPMSARRLRMEMDKLHKCPVEGIIARPMESNILDWRYVIRGSEDTPYVRGQYYGKVKFPHDYPMTPPSILMLTPSGRFEVNTRICMSMSDFHPETWNPAWSVGKILIGLQSFMNSEELTTGGIKADEATRKDFAAKSWAFNAKDKTFQDVFPEDFDELMAEQQTQIEAMRAADVEAAKAEQKKKVEAEAKKVEDKRATEDQVKQKEKNRMRNLKKKQKAKAKKLAANSESSTDVTAQLESLDMEDE